MTTSATGTDLPFIPAPRDPGCPLKPPAVFGDWRESEGLQLATWQGHPTWVVSRYKDIRAALTDPRLSANTIRDSMKPTADDDHTPVIFPRIDDPEHNRLRRMMTSEFTYRRSEAMRPGIQEIVDSCLDDMIRGGPPADLVRDLALPVPSRVISLLLGVPYEDHEFFQHHSTAGIDARATDEEKVVSILALLNYMLELLERKEREPGDDLMSRLMTDYVATGALNRETAAMNGLIMLQAGHETTASMIALGTLALIEHPAELARLRETDDPAVTANIVEEMMRYLSIVHSLVERVALEDLTIAGQRVSEGDVVLMNLPAGNWDPAYAGDPDTFDAGRNARGHLGFGFGVHQCIGANLARVELQATFATLARRLPDIRLAVPAEDLRFKNEKEIYGIHELPVSW